MEEASSVFRSWLTKVKVPPGLRVFIGISIVTSLYILNPGASPVLVVPNSELHLQVPVFRYLVIQFTQPQQVKSCILGRPEVYTHVLPGSLTTGSEQSMDGDAVTTLKLVNCYTNDTGPVHQMVQPIKISISSDHMGIASVCIDDQAVPLDERETPRLCRGGSQSLTVPGIYPGREIGLPAAIRIGEQRLAPGKCALPVLEPVLSRSSVVLLRPAPKARRTSAKGCSTSVLTDQAALSRSTSDKPPALPEVADMNGRPPGFAGEAPRV